MKEKDVNSQKKAEPASRTVPAKTTPKPHGWNEQQGRGFTSSNGRGFPQGQSKRSPSRQTIKGQDELMKIIKNMEKI